MLRPCVFDSRCVERA